MVHALSNPYELTLKDITCKASPFGTGFFISNGDLEKLGRVRAGHFTKALFETCEAEQSKELDGIKVFSLKPKGKQDVKVNNEVA